MSDSLLAAFFDHLVDRGASPSTVKAIRYDFGSLARWHAQAHHGQALDLAELTDRDVRAWSCSAAEGAAAPATTNRRLASLRRFYRWAIAQGYLSADPTRDVRPARASQATPRSVSSAAIDRVLHAARKQDDPNEALRDEAMLAVLAFGGLRVAELAALLVADYNPATGKLLIRHGKGGKSRSVFLIRQATTILDRYLRQLRCPGGLLAGPAADVPLWMHRGQGEGRPWTPGITKRAVQELVRTLADAEAARLRAEAETARRADTREALELLALELAGLTCHTFRHALARRMLDADADLSEIQRVLGHQSIRTTGVYLTPGDDQMRAVMEESAGLR